MTTTADHKLKVYFGCSIRGGREEVAAYQHIVNYLKDRVELLTEIFADGKLTAQGMNKPSEVIWETDMNWLRMAQAVVVEVTQPSLGVGYEIAQAEHMKKPILCLFREDGSRKLSAMVEGSPYLTVVKYKEIAEAEKAIDGFIAGVTAV